MDNDSFTLLYLSRIMTELSYSGGAHFTATGLKKPGQIAYLEVLYSKEIKAKEALRLEEERLDAMAGSGSLTGSAIHKYVLDYAKDVYPEWLIEQRLKTLIDGELVSGQPDFLMTTTYGDVSCLTKTEKGYSVPGKVRLGNNGEVICADVKTGSNVWVYNRLKKGDLEIDVFQDWTAQLNVYAYLALKFGLKPIGLRVEYYYIDKNKVYPLILESTLWSIEEQEYYIRSQVKRLVAARNGTYPYCTPREQWRDKNGENPKRCEGFCDVSEWCKQYQAELKSIPVTKSKKSGSRPVNFKTEDVFFGGD